MSPSSWPLQQVAEIEDGDAFEGLVHRMLN
jgi:hypothetical protein